VSIVEEAIHVRFNDFKIEKKLLDLSEFVVLQEP